MSSANNLIEFSDAFIFAWSKEFHRVLIGSIRPAVNPLIKSTRAEAPKIAEAFRTNEWRDSFNAYSARPV